VDSARPHLALLTTTLDVSGAERVIALLADGLAREGYQVSVLGLQRRSGDLGRLVREPSVRVSDLGVSGSFDLGVLARLRRWLIEERVTILYTFLFHANVIGRVAGRAARIPHLLSSQQVAAWGGWGRRALERWTARWCDCIVAVSPGVRDDVIDRMRVPADRVRVIVNAIDVDAFHPLTRPFERVRTAGHMTLGSASRLAPEKDHETLIRGFAQAVRSQPGLRLRLAGDGPLAGRIADLVGELGLTSTVEMLGRIDDVQTFHDSLDVYVQPSRTEGLPVAVIEAMAMGRPVIATDVPGNRDVVVNNVTGWLIPPGSATAWADAIGQAVEAPEANRMGEAGRQRVEAYFDAKVMVADTMRLLDELRQCTRVRRVAQ
jgi:glycosyltransferase involved in cell wall biosynthesis